MQYPLQFNVYKTQAAIQMNLSHPKEGPKGKDKPGCIFVEATRAKAKREYDWREEVKIKFALGLVDIYKLLFALRTMGEGGSVSLVHDKHAGTDKAGEVITTMQVSSPKGVSFGIYIILQQKIDNNKRQHSVGMDGPETLCFATLLQAAIPVVLGWN